MTWVWLAVRLTAQRIDGSPWLECAARRRGPSRQRAHCTAVVPKMTVSPPSTTCSVPVVKADSSDARYTISQAMFSGTPRQPSGIPAVAEPVFNAVWICPG